MKIGSTAPNTREEITKPRNPCPQPDDPDANTAHHAPECKGTPGPKNKQTKKLQHANRTCGRAPSANVANPPPAPAHTHAAPPPPPATGTQAPTQPPGIQNRRESWIARCSPLPHTPRSSQNNQHNRKPTSAPLSPD